jgi:hypothetical protein
VQVAAELGIELDPMVVFEHSNPHELARHLFSKLAIESSDTEARAHRTRRALLSTPHLSTPLHSVVGTRSKHALRDLVTCDLVLV